MNIGLSSPISPNLREETPKPIVPQAFAIAICERMKPAVSALESAFK